MTVVRVYACATCVGVLVDCQRERERERERERARERELNIKLG